MLLFLFHCGTASAQERGDPRFLAPISEAGKRVERYKKLLGKAAGSEQAEPARIRLRSAQAWLAALRRAAARSAPQDSLALVAAARGDTVLKRAGQRLSPYSVGLLRDGDRLTTGASSYLDIRITDGSRITAGPRTFLRAVKLPRAASPGTSLSLEAGRLLWTREPGSGGTARVVTSSGIVDIGPGRTEVEALPGGAARVTTYEGRSETRARNRSGTPAADELWWKEAY